MEELEIARQMPHNEDAEKAVLGAMIFDRDTIGSCQEILKKEFFYRSDYGEIFEAIVEVYKSGSDVNIITVQEQLKGKNLAPEVCSLEFLGGLVAFSPTTTGAVDFSNIIKNMYLLREVIKTTQGIEKQCYSKENNIDDVFELTEKRLIELTKKRTVGDIKPISEVVNEQVREIDRNYKNHGQVTGIPTGFNDLDFKLSGFHESELILIAARPAMGKTAFVLNIAQHMSISNDIPCVLFSLEMSAGQLVNRLFALESGIDAGKIRTGDLQDEEWMRLMEGSFRVGGSKLIIDDTPGITLRELVNKARHYHRTNGIQCVIIDYLQLLVTGGKIESRQQEVSEISRALKALARELEVPVIALSQLSRAVEKRDDKRPMLSDLRESGSIEQDADVVMFIYRDDYYNKDSEKPGVAEIIVAKQRAGSTGPVELKWIGERTKFANLARDRDAQQYGEF